VLMAALALSSVGPSASPAAAVAAANKTVGHFFYSPSRNIECRFSNGAIACAAFSNGRIVVLNREIPAWTQTVTRGFGNGDSQCRVFPHSEDVPCWFQPGGRGPVLSYGASATDPLGQVAPGYSIKHTYRCTSFVSGIVCRSLVSGLEFNISNAGVVRLTAGR
jgi:hypothetical protein